MADHDGVLTTKVSPWSVPETVARLLAVIAARGMHVVAVIDLCADARKAGFTLVETTVVLFGDPALATPIMRARPMSALDFPLKVVVLEDVLETTVTYLASRAFATRYELRTELVATISCVDDIVDAVIDR